MSNKGLIIEERARDIGDFLVGRLLPFRKKRMVGPFIFIDHMGPSTVKKGSYMDVGQHPHIGLSTLTYLFEGEVRHCDSIGSDLVIKPGAVNWMTAGKGVTHTERTPDYLRKDGLESSVHGFQIWVALPKELEFMEPEFHHFEKEQLPTWENNDTSYTLIAGEGYGRKSPVPVHTDLFMIEVKTKKETALNIQGEVKGEIGICVVKGHIIACDQKIDAGNMIVSKTEDACKVILPADTHLLLFGGETMLEDRHIFWNFVATEQETIEAAKKRWKDKEFPKVEGDTSYVPLPE
ncbi:pirin family protein [Galbibacter sp. EGI 63066]|uniref:pirin family protein n=1 Tax=Galbibacter sp. EGI 63066 TaxID=2993559 RepID=UPI002248CB99|nr:pirin family protein [Galbibacter sp. EGI 63066]MCX2679973.1 pirin family protein [Galbibacter sp. EGI 63066]